MSTSMPQRYFLKLRRRGDENRNTVIASFKDEITGNIIFENPLQNKSEITNVIYEQSSEKSALYWTRWT